MLKAVEDLFETAKGRLPVLSSFMVLLQTTRLHDYTAMHISFETSSQDLPCIASLAVHPKQRS